MKKMELGKGRTICTPWLTVTEAAAYCDYSRDKFMSVAAEQAVRHGGGAGVFRRYHVEEIDRIMNQAAGL